MKLKITLALVILSICSLTLSAQKSNILKVPYQVQPTDKTCQSTCLKMIGMYESFPSINTKKISDIYNEINTSPNRPDKQNTNSWKNIAWWLNNSISASSYSIYKTKDQIKAIEHLVDKIDKGNPVILSTNNTKTSGHIVLVVGYINYIKGQSTEGMKFICHDPYGKFFPSLHSDLYGSKRYDFGMSLPDSSQNGVGKGVEITPNNLKRFRDSSHHTNYYVMISK